MPNSLRCKIKHLCHNGTLTERERDRILKALEQEPKTGQWVKIKPYPLQMHDYECSECGHETNDNTEDYCSNCGAKMVKEQESEKINCKFTKCENCINHNYCDYEPPESDIEKRKPCINYSDGCEEWNGCPCVYYNAESEVKNE